MLFSTINLSLVNTNNIFLKNNYSFLNKQIKSDIVHF